MRLDLRYTIWCDGCGETRVLDTRDRSAAAVAAAAMGWRTAIDDNGAVTYCRGCMAKLDARTKARLLARHDGELADLRLDRPRYRPGSRACTKCHNQETYDRLVYVPHAAKVAQNLLCIPCAFNWCRHRGYAGWVDTPLPVKGGEGRTLTDQVHGT